MITKGCVNKVRKQITDQEKIFAMDLVVEGLGIRINMKNSYKSN